MTVMSLGSTKLVFLFVLWCAVCAVGGVTHYWDNIIVGAGPSGLQLGYFFQRAQRDYVILERANVSGNFFVTYPRHNKLISINKRHTGKTNKEFNLRHDWNSLLSDDESLLLRHYSREFFPPRELYLTYLRDYQQKLGINVKHNTDVRNIRKERIDTRDHFVMEDQNGNTYTCKTLILATGMSVPNIPEFEGVEHTEGYEDVSTNPDDFEGQTVLILGRGNSAFEVADSIYGSTNLIHMIGRSRVRLSWATHYVGDLRAINNGLLDTYQLKSLDGVLEAPMEEVKIIKKDDKLYLSLVDDGEDNFFDNFALRDSYDRVIRCLGFSFDDSILNSTLTLDKGKGRKKKYPLIGFNYEAATIPGLFFAGTATHSLDHRKSAGGFIHGFRYTARALFRLLECRNYEVAWPYTSGNTTDLLNVILKRLNEGSGFYQMFGMLGDVITLDDHGKTFKYHEEFPVNLLWNFERYANRKVGPVLVVMLEYGANFSGAGHDIFREDRATGEPSEAHRSNFLHPVIYYYKKLPKVEQMSNRAPWEILPKPDRLHHMVEDFLTTWDGPTSHILPLRRFLEYIFDEDLRNFFAEDCMKMALAFKNVPRTCREQFLQGEGIVGTEPLLNAASKAGLLL